MQVGVGLVVDGSRPTTLKQNLIGLAQARHPQKMFRVDIESREAISEGTLRELCAAVDRGVDEVDVVCIEDYNKGVCTEALCQHVIRAAKKAGKPEPCRAHAGAPGLQEVPRADGDSRRIGRRRS